MGDHRTVGGFFQHDGQFSNMTASSSHRSGERRRWSRRRRSVAATLGSILALVAADIILELDVILPVSEDSTHRILCGDDQVAAATKLSKGSKSLFIQRDDGTPASFPYRLWKEMLAPVRRVLRRLASDEGDCDFTDYVYTLTNAALEAQVPVQEPPPSNPGDPTISSAPTAAPVVYVPAGSTGGESSGGTYVDPAAEANITATSDAANTTTTTSTIQRTGNGYTYGDSGGHTVTSPLAPPPEEGYGADLTAPSPAPANNIAYVLTIHSCPAGPLTGSPVTNANFYDTFSMLRHSVCNCTVQNLVPDPGSAELVPISSYDSTMYAFLHSSATVCTGPNAQSFDMVASLQGMGFFVKIYDEAIYNTEIVGSDYARGQIDRTVGIRSLVQLHAFDLTEHSLAVFVDASTMVLQPMDDIYDQFFADPQLMAAFTTKESGTIDTGMMIIRPSSVEFESLKNVYKTASFTPIDGWAATSLGTGNEGISVEGFLTYYFKSFANPAASLELDRCIYGNNNEAACRDTNIHDIKVARMSGVCGEPWQCEFEVKQWDAQTERLCNEFMGEWSRKRLDFETNHWGNPSAASRTGNFHADTFQGYCNAEGSYNYETMLGLEPTTSLFDLANIRGACANDESRFNICLDIHVSSGNSAWTNALKAAQMKWEMAVVGDLEPVIAPNDPEWVCDGGMPKVIDDVYICAKDSYIDGVGGVLGTAQPRYRRGDNNLPISGGMHFDVDDIQALIFDNTWANVVRHEMAHILGVGALWEEMGLLDTSSGTVKYTGPYACAAWRSLTGCPAGSCPPVEQSGGAGTAGSHWDEDALGTEIMTGYASNSGNDPISLITIGTLNDMGYSVNYDVSDPYTVPTPVDCGAASRRRLTTQTNSNLKGGFLNWNQRGVRHISQDGRILSEGATLSQEGFDLATSHGKQVLSNSKKQRPGHEQGNAVFVGHMHTDVWYKEGDTIFLVDVAGDCGESTEYCEYHAECCSKNCLSNKCTT